MSVSYRAVGVIEHTRVERLRSIVRVFEELGINVPDEVELEISESAYVEGLGATISLPATEAQNEDMQEWIYVHVADIPDNVRAVAFIASY